MLFFGNNPAGRRAIPATIPGRVWPGLPPKTWEVRSSGGLPVTAIALGKLLIPLVIRRQARRQLPHNTARLKEMLERA